MKLDFKQIKKEFPLALALLEQFLAKKFKATDPEFKVDTKGVLWFRNVPLIPISIPIEVTAELLYEFFDKETVVTNVMGSPTGDSWGFVIFAGKKSTPVSMKTNIVNRKEATYESILASFLVLNDYYAQITKNKIYN